MQHHGLDVVVIGARCVDAASVLVRDRYLSRGKVRESDDTLNLFSQIRGPQSTMGNALRSFPNTIAEQSHSPNRFDVKASRLASTRLDWQDGGRGSDVDGAGGVSFSDHFHL